MEFNGFLKETIDFLWEFRFNNNKEWFEKNRDRYIQLLKEPMELFSQDANNKMSILKIDYKTVPVISRINRDIRFSKDKSPYRAKRWVVFKPENGSNVWKDKPVFFFEIMPEEYSYGMGFYETSPKIMSSYRNKIDANVNEFLTLIDNFSKQKVFKLEGENYKRSFKNIENKQLFEWYQKKNIAFVCHKEIDKILFSKDLIDNIINDFSLLVPLNNFLIAVS